MVMKTENRKIDSSIEAENANDSSVKLKYEKESQQQIENNKKFNELLTRIRKDKIALDGLSNDDRNIIIADFNSKKENKGIAELLKEKPDKEYTDKCKEDFIQLQNLPLKKEFLISTTKEETGKIIDFLIDWNTNWSSVENQEWLGILYFDKIMKAKKNIFDKKGIYKFTLDFNSIMYLNTIFAHPKGTGLKFAQWMKENTDTFDKVDKILEKAMTYLKEINRKTALYREKWSLACSGFKMKILISKLEDFGKLDDTDPNANNTPDSPAKNEAKNEAKNVKS